MTLNKKRLSRTYRKTRNSKRRNSKRKNSKRRNRRNSKSRNSKSRNSNMLNKEAGKLDIFKSKAEKFLSRVDDNTLEWKKSTHIDNSNIYNKGTNIAQAKIHTSQEYKNKYINAKKDKKDIAILDYYVYTKDDEYVKQIATNLGYWSETQTSKYYFFTQAYNTQSIYEKLPFNQKSAYYSLLALIHHKKLIELENHPVHAEAYSLFRLALTRAGKSRMMPEELAKAGRDTENIGYAGTPATYIGGGIFGKKSESELLGEFTKYATMTVNYATDRLREPVQIAKHSKRNYVKEEKQKMGYKKPGSNGIEYYNVNDPLTLGLESYMIRHKCYICLREARKFLNVALINADMAQVSTSNTDSKTENIFSLPSMNPKDIPKIVSKSMNDNLRSLIDDYVNKNKKSGSLSTDFTSGLDFGDLGLKLQQLENEYSMSNPSSLSPSSSYSTSLNPNPFIS